MYVHYQPVIVGLYYTKSKSVKQQIATSSSCCTISRKNKKRGKPKVVDFLKQLSPFEMKTIPHLGDGHQ